MKTYYYIFALVLLCASCGQSENPYTINKQHIGLLTDSTSVKDLDAIFSNDSVVINNQNGAYSNRFNAIEVYDKSGTKLLALTPNSLTKNDSKINSVQIFDKRFKTKKGITTASTFKDLKDNYTITKIDNLLRSVVVSVKELNATFSIDKKELPENIRYNNDIEIEALNIPEKAPIKHFMIHWN